MSLAKCFFMILDQLFSWKQPCLECWPASSIIPLLPTIICPLDLGQGGPGHPLPMRSSNWRSYQIAFRPSHRGNMIHRIGEPLWRGYICLLVEFFCLKEVAELAGTLTPSFGKRPPFWPQIAIHNMTISKFLDNVENDYIDLEDNDDGKVDSRVKRLLLVRLYADDSHLDHNPSVTSWSWSLCQSLAARGRDKIPTFSKNPKLAAPPFSWSCGTVPKLLRI